jgi:hypothetical protein
MTIRIDIDVGRIPLYSSKDLDKSNLKQEETTQYAENSLPISRDNTKTLLYQEHSTTIAKRQASRDNTLSFSSNRQVKHPQSIKREIERISQVGRKFQPRVCNSQVRVMIK